MESPGVQSDAGAGLEGGDTSQQAPGAGGRKCGHAV